MALRQPIRMIHGKSTVPIGNLPAGMYTAVYSNDAGERIGQIRFFAAK